MKDGDLGWDEDPRRTGILGEVLGGSHSSHWLGAGGTIPFPNIPEREFGSSGDRSALELSVLGIPQPWNCRYWDPSDLELSALGIPHP